MREIVAYLSGRRSWIFATAIVAFTLAGLTATVSRAGAESSVYEAPYEMAASCSEDPGSAGGPIAFLNPLGGVCETIVSGHWIEHGKKIALNLFLSLCVIEITIIGINQGLFKSSPEELLASVAFKVFVMTVMCWVISNADGFFLGIVNGFRGSARSVSGSDESTVFIVVSGFVAAQVALMGAAGAADSADYFSTFLTGMFGMGSGTVGPTAAHGHQHSDIVLMLHVLALLLLFAAAAIILQWALINIESFIVILGGIVMLGFAGTKFTLPFAQGYMSYSINVGVRLFTLYLVLAIEKNLVAKLLLDAGVAAARTAIGGPSIFASDVALGVCALAICQALVLAGLVVFVPNLAGSFMSGSAGTNATQMMGSMVGAFSSAIAASTFGKAAQHAASQGEALRSNVSALRSGGGSDGGGISSGGKTDDTGSTSATNIGAVHHDGDSGVTSSHESGASPQGNGVSAVGNSHGSRPGGSNGAGGASVPALSRSAGTGDRSGPTSTGTQAPLTSGGLPIGPASGATGKSGSPALSAEPLDAIGYDGRKALSQSEALAAYDATGPKQRNAVNFDGLSAEAREHIASTLETRAIDADALRDSERMYATQSLRGAVPTGEQAPSAVQVRFDR